MRVTRRGFLGGGLVLAGALTGLTLPSWSDPGVAAPAGTTLEQVLLPRSARRRFRTLMAFGGEPHRVRTDLGIEAAAGREDRRELVVGFAHLTDIHVVDAQSPLRFEYLDRYYSARHPHGRAYYRPHEMMSAAVADAMVRAVVEHRVGPVLGAPLGFALNTGDSADNAQHNEVRWAVDLLDGGRVNPDSGDPARWEGVAGGDPQSWDDHYWHPGGPPPGHPADLPTATRDFPTVPGLLDAVRAPFDAAGLGMAWYAALGNHDELVAGDIGTASRLSRIAVGDRKIFTAPHDLRMSARHAVASGTLEKVLRHPPRSSCVQAVTPDPHRRLLSRAEIVDEHFTTTGTPVGHGFTTRNREQHTAYYAFDRGMARFLVLDTVDPRRGPRGSLDRGQFDWLARQLRAARGRAVVIASHHTLATMTEPGHRGMRVLGPEVEALVLAHREVVAWVNGHQHRNKVWAHRRPAGGGFWEINTASHIDWPMQSRLVEIVDNRDGTLSIFATMLDHDGPVTSALPTRDTTGLAGLARELSANDWQERHAGRRGTRADRNVELLVGSPTRPHP
ncbi:MAG: TIGR03767 family metallophosphoesterase [Nocardioidaceae bacterium]